MFHDFILLSRTSAFTFAPLVARNGGTPCWIPFSSAVPGFALPNRFRGVRDLCFTVVEGPLCARLPIYFLIQRQRSPSRHLWRVMVERLVGSHFHWLFLASLSQIVSARSMDFPLRVGEGPLAVQFPLFPDPTSGVRGQRTLCAVPWTPLLESVFILLQGILRTLRFP